MGILDVFSTSTQGMSTQSYALQNISGNIANASTVGFKRTDTGFSDLIPDTGTVNQTSGSVGAYSELTSTVAGTTSGTGISTNMALSGAGFFAVTQAGSSGTPSTGGQTLFTRRGDFSQDANGFLVNGAGYYLLGTSSNPGTGASSGSASSPIKISNATSKSGASLSSLSVETDGTVTGTYSDGGTAALGKVAVAQLSASSFLQTQDGGAYAQTTTSGTPQYTMAGSAITGGAVEGSNTDISDQFSKMIATQQAYQSNTKVLTTANEMMQDAINILR